MLSFLIFTVCYKKLYSEFTYKIMTNLNNISDSNRII